jgi:acyl-[acyl-carrier-protein]-phospholipid O-acyltransferase/long-chain-fatty-acid--[acyl-carrier-protein] ligase
MHPFFKRFSSFTYLNITQFLGAMNDNIYKLLIVFFFIQLEGIENSHIILSTAGATFVLPFLLFASSAGILADRYSKRTIIFLTKLLELVIMILGFIAFSYASKWGSYCILFLMATQSAFFSPSKYGILPELLPSDKISRANGLMTSFTYLAVILGTFLASFLLDITQRDFLLASSFCILISLIGLFTSFCIEHTPPSGSCKRLNARILTEIYKTLQILKQEPSLLAAVLGSAYFLFLAAFIQLNIIPFAVQSLHLTDVQGGYLFLLTAIGIGTGSIVAGKISGKSVELALVPLAGIGLTITLYMLDLFSDNLAFSIPLVIILGLLGGIYLIPLDSYIQIASPKQYIGQAIAANTFLSFFGVLCASGLLYLLTAVFDINADKGFTVVGTLTLAVTIISAYQFFDYVTRFIGMLLSRLHFKTTLHGKENIPDVPTLYMCTHTAWNDTLLLLGVQRRRVRFFIEHEKEHSKWLKRLYRLLRVVLIPEIEPIENSKDSLVAMKNALNNGVSVCIFIDKPDVTQEFEKLKNTTLVREIFQETQCPMVAIVIEKGEKEHQSRFFTSLLNRCRVPAAMTFESISWDKPTFPNKQNAGATLKKNETFFSALEKKGYRPAKGSAHN